MSFTRHLDIDGVFNLRDVGHYTTHDGRTVRPGRLFRCGALHDVPALGHLDIRTVLDLRTADEIERDAIACGPIRELDGVRRVSLSLIPQNVDGLGVTAYLDSLVGPGISARRYFKYLEIAGANIRAAIELFGDPNAFPAVVHCTAGKDRTGVLVALLLDLVGVPRKTIVEDYELSNRATRQLVEHIQTVTQTEYEPSESELARFGAPPEAMDGMLQSLHREHGSAEGYLRGLGVEVRVLAAIRDALLTPEGRAPRGPVRPR